LSDGTVGVAGVVDTLDVVATSVAPTVTAAFTVALAGTARIAVATRATAEAIAISGFFNEVMFVLLIIIN
jgi:hypothetical protein